MALSFVQRLKVMLLLAGYLFVVLSHLHYLKPQASAHEKHWYTQELTPQGYDKAGNAFLIIKKIDKSVLNRFTAREGGPEPHVRFGAVLNNRSVYSASVINAVRLQPQKITLPVKRYLYLRI